jgi:pimeloyl-ACP methyl ester carboxylesterase
MTTELLDQVMALAPPGTQRLELPDADHHVMLDQPQAFAQLLATLVPAAPN